MPPDSPAPELGIVSSPSREQPRDLVSVVPKGASFSPATVQPYPRVPLKLSSFETYTYSKTYRALARRRLCSSCSNISRLSFSLVSSRPRILARARPLFRLVSSSPHLRLLMPGVKLFSPFLMLCRSLAFTLFALQKQFEINTPKQGCGSGLN